VLDGMFNVRRMFGGNLAVGWPAALVAGHFMDGFIDRFKEAVRVSEEFYATIAHNPAISVERIPAGTNLARITVKGVDLANVSRRLAERGILLPAANRAGVLTLGVNETWNRTTGTDLARAFEQALT
jgi:threonine aldolase